MVVEPFPTAGAVSSLLGAGDALDDLCWRLVVLGGNWDVFQAGPVAAPGSGGAPPRPSKVLAKEVITGEHEHEQVHGDIHGTVLRRGMERCKASFVVLGGNCVVFRAGVVAVPGWADDLLKHPDVPANGVIAVRARARARGDIITEPVQALEMRSVEKCKESFVGLAGDCIVSRAGLVAGQGGVSPSLLNDLAIATNAAHEGITIDRVPDRMVARSRRSCVVVEWICVDDMSFANLPLFSRW